MDWTDEDQDYLESDIQGFTLWSTKMAETFKEFQRVMESTGDSFRRMIAAWATTGKGPRIPYKRSKWSGYGRG